MSLVWSLAHARASWWRATTLSPGASADRPVPGGWLRALGGVDPYLAVFARDPSRSRQAIDEQLASGALQVVPGVRNCIWVVPAAQVSLALAVSEAQRRAAMLRELARLDVDGAMLDRLGDAVQEVLSDGVPRDPGTLRAALGEALVPSLGEAGKKKGHSTPLPSALRLLEWDGRIRRHCLDNRLDTGTYLWSTSVARPDPPDSEAAATLLWRLMLAWGGPVTLDEMTQWSGLTKTKAKKALKQLDHVTDTLYTDDSQVEIVIGTATAAPEPRGVALLPSQDNWLTLRQSPALLLDPAHHDREVLAMMGRTVTLGASRWVHQRPLALDGELRGFWEWDEDSDAVLWFTFDPVGTEDTTRIDAAAAMTGTFIREQLGGVARANSVDSEKARKKRVAAVRAGMAETGRG